MQGLSLPPVQEIRHTVSTVVPSACAAPYNLDTYLQCVCLDEQIEREGF